MKIIAPVICSGLTCGAIAFGAVSTGLLQGMSPIPPFAMSWHWYLSIADAPTGNGWEVFIPVWVIIMFWLWLWNRR